MTAQSVRVFNGALDERGTDTVLRGVVSPDTFHLLQVAPYQREILPQATIAGLMHALQEGRVPDIVLGMRGSRQSDDGRGVIRLLDPVFVIDGLQRVTAARELLKRGTATPHLGATILFDTTEESERDLFRRLNVERINLSTNVVLRNDRADVPVLDVLARLCEAPEFCLSGRVCWQQRMARNHLVTAVTFVKVVAMLHSRFGGPKESHLDRLVRGLQTVMEQRGQQFIRQNTQTLFDIVEECWGVRRIAYRDGAVYMRLAFLISLAELFTKFDVFWQGGTLQVERGYRRKLSTFPLDDPHIAKLAGSGLAPRALLFRLLLDHVNSGKRTRRLVDPAVLASATLGEEDITDKLRQEAEASGV